MKKIKDALKEMLGRLPLAVEALWFWRWRHGTFHFDLGQLDHHFPVMLKQIAPFVQKAPRGNNIFLFAFTHYWVNESVNLGLALAGMGHRVTLGYLPDSEWNKSTSRYDLRVKNLYAHRILEKSRATLNPISFLDIRPEKSLPDALQEQVDKVSVIDTQYVLQNETVDKNHWIYQMRKERNDYSARVALALLRKNRPSVVIVPNGMIFEFGAVYETARFLGIKTVTYEFGDAADGVWISQDSPVVHHETDDIWDARHDLPLTQDQRQKLASFFVRRQQPDLDDNFVWLSQPSDIRGGEKTLDQLGLDDRPVVLLATNVLGDSLTLGRQIFSPTMIEWVKRTLEYFVGHPEVQLIVRIHPGEGIMVGPTSANEVIKQVLPDPPEHIHIVKAKDPVNTYDLLDITHLGLVYVTTVGLEMAVRGIPVIVSGRTHYRERGFTIDPVSWEDYYSSLDKIIKQLPDYHLTPGQVEIAWNYAYRFFFEFPRPFPWHLSKIWKDIDTKPMQYVLGEGFSKYRSTFKYFSGEPIVWKNIDSESGL